MTQPFAGPDTRRGRTRRGARRRAVPRLISSVFASALAIALVAGPAAAQASVLPTSSQAGTVITAATPTPTAEPAEVTITLAPFARGVIRSGEGLTASIVIDNPTPNETAAATLSTAIGDLPLATSSEIDAWIAAGTVESTFSVVDSQAAPVVSARSTASVGLTVTADAPALARGAGVYPIRTTSSTGEESRSVVVFADTTAATTIPVAVLVPVTAGPLTRGLLTADELSALTAADGRLTAILTGVSMSSAVLAIDPAILASIRVLGTAAPASALAWLERLNALPNARFALQFGDADPAVQVHAGLSGPLLPTSLTYAMSAANFTLASTTTPSPEATPQPDPSTTTAPDPTLPDLDELLAVPRAMGAIWWPAGGAADDTVATTLAAWSRASDPSSSPVTVVSAESVGGTALGASSAVVGDAPVLVYDDEVAAALAASAVDGDGPRGGDLAVVSAHLALALADATGPVLIASDRLDDVSAGGLQSALNAVLGFPGVASSTWNDVAGSASSSVSLTARVDEDATAALGDLLGSEQQIEAFASILDDPTLLTGPERSAILQLTGAGWSDRSLWADAVDDHAEATETTLESVTIQPPTTIQLLSPETPLPFYVRNALPWPVNVVLIATPDNLRLDVDRSTAVIAEPGVNTRVLVPVRARVGSGEVDIDLRLVSHTGVQLGPVQSAEVQVRADWERIGVIVMIVVVGGLLVVGIVRTVTRRRRVRAEAGAETETEADGG